MTRYPMMIALLAAMLMLPPGWEQGTMAQAMKVEQSVWEPQLVLKRWISTVTVRYLVSVKKPLFSENSRVYRA